MSAKPKNDTFFCTQCAGCCHKKNLRQYNLEHWGLTIGEDGYCSNLKDNLCTIYEDRPLICRVGEIYDRVDELRDIEPQLVTLIDKVKSVCPDNPKLEYFKVANMGCNYLIRRLHLGDQYFINVDEAYMEVDKNPEMIDKPKDETKKEDRIDKKKSKREYRIERIKAITAKALAVAKKRKWLVFLIGIGIAAYFVISSGSFSGVFNTIKGLFGK
jgi:Fe-S-cluster containining protein